jgi:hypothetical protein
MSEVAARASECRCSAAGSEDNADFAPHQVFGKALQPLLLSFGPAVLDRDVATFDEAHLG